MGGRSASKHLGMARKWFFVSVIQGCGQSWTKQDLLTCGYNWQVFHAKLRFSNVLRAVVNAGERVVNETLFSCTSLKRHQKKNCWKMNRSDGIDFTAYVERQRTPERKKCEYEENPLDTSSRIQSTEKIKTYASKTVLDESCSVNRR